MILGIRLAVAFGFCLFAAFGFEPAKAKDSAKASETPATRGLPEEVATSHTITLADEKISFTARAGAVRLYDATSETPQADVAFVSYERPDADKDSRPLAFVFNGGPGAASAWLGLGMISPWRLRFLSDPPSPSIPPLIAENAESWIAFTDLVFIDPPGAGYSKILGEGADLRKHLYSVEGDIDALAVVMRKWLASHKRFASPKYLVGESYGGFRALKLLRTLRERENVGVDGVVLISPVLDFAWLDDSRNLLAFAARLPSYAAVARSAKDRADVADAETFAAGDYISDLLKGVKDENALSRLTANVARFAGLDRDVVARVAGRVDVKTFARERRRSQREALSLYDGEVASPHPAPLARESDWADPVLDSLRAPLGAAMSWIVAEKLHWPVGEARYEILNERVAHEWNYGRGGKNSAEAMTDLAQALALDRRMKVLIAHGLADLVTPYFATKLLLDQLPAYGEDSRLRFLVLTGGHMPYLRDQSRRALRDAARATILGK